MTNLSFLELALAAEEIVGKSDGQVKYVIDNLATIEILDGSARAKIASFITDTNHLPKLRPIRDELRRRLAK